MKLHFHAERNWLNDPNGLCQVNGWYHLFYQYNPHGLEWGDIHWGHARSRDLYRWEHLPVAMTPDAGKGELHCFSGSCCKDREGRPHFFYTSIGDPEKGRGHMDGAQQWMAEPADESMLRLCQTDAFAMKDDMHGSVIPRDWRDPCVVPYGDGYLMVLGGSVDGKGCILLYTSQDMKHWTYRHILVQADTADDVPWECPNLFFLDGKAVIFFSPCSAVRYMVGTLDETLHFHAETSGLLDPAGRDGYYAPQVLRDEQDRTILMSWMPECDGGTEVARRGWNGCMALPRLLHIVNGDLHASLMEGWQELCGEAAVLHCGQEKEVQTRAGRHYVLKLPLRANQTVSVTLLADETGEEQTVLTCRCNAETAEVMLDRSASTTLKEASRIPLGFCAPLEKGETTMLLCVDDHTVEVCVNGRWLSTNAYPLGAADMLTIRTDCSTTAQLFPVL